MRWVTMGSTRPVAVLCAGLGLAAVGCATASIGAEDTATTLPAAETTLPAPPSTTVPETTTTTAHPPDFDPLPTPPPALEPIRFAEIPVDRDFLPAALGAAGLRPPADGALFAAVIVEGRGGPSYQLFEAGRGADWSRFWPASSVKAIAAVAALDRLAGLGFDETATVRFPDGATSRVADLVRSAIEDSSNPAGDRLAQLASPGYVAGAFADAAGLPGIALGSSFTGIDVHDRRPLRVQQGEDEAVTVAQPAGPRRQHSATLRQLADVIRRIVLADRIPAGERLRVSASGLSLLREATCAAEPKFFGAAVAGVFGPGTVVCNKAGWNENRCIDAAWVSPPGSPVSILLAAVDERTPGCRTLDRMAEATLRALAERFAIPQVGTG